MAINTTTIYFTLYQFKWKSFSYTLFYSCHNLFLRLLILPNLYFFLCENILKLHLTRKLYNSYNFRWLTLENNQLSELPNKFSSLKNLTHLNLKNNCLKQFPKQLCAIESLRYCYLCSNNIEYLNDECLNDTTFMKLLDINDNPFPDDNLNYKVNLSTCSIIYANAIFFHSDYYFSTANTNCLTAKRLYK